MKLVATLCIGILVQGVFAHMPTVYEFCSHVVANGDGGRASCDASQCQGRPGKIGPVGLRGIPGIKGIKGDQGTSEGLNERVRILEDFHEKVTDVLQLNDAAKGIFCYMGMKNYEIPDSSITASSSYNGDHAPRLGRLDKPSSPGAGAWCARQSRIGEWIQVDFGQSKLVAGVVTQGRAADSYPQWVRSYKVSCGSSVDSLKIIKENGVDKVFNGNNDRNTKMANKFSQPVTCRYIRILPLTWNAHISMRVEFIHGLCHDFY